MGRCIIVPKKSTLRGIAGTLEEDKWSKGLENCDDVRKNQGGTRSRSVHVVTQRTAKIPTHGRVDRERSHGGDLADTQGITDGNRIVGKLGADRELIGSNDTDGFGDQVG